MPSPWVQRALLNDLPAKALDRTPTESEKAEALQALLEEEDTLDFDEDEERDWLAFDRILPAS